MNAAAGSIPLSYNYLIDLAKILLVQLRFKINPYSKKTFLTLGIILILYLTISEISFEFDPFVSLVLRSVLITAAFSLLAYLLKLTIDLQQFFSKILPFIKRG